MHEKCPELEPALEIHGDQTAFALSNHVRPMVVVWLPPSQSRRPISSGPGCSAARRRSGEKGPLILARRSAAARKTRKKQTMRGIVVFPSLEQALRAGYQVHERTSEGFFVRTRTANGWALAVVILRPAF